MAQFEGAVDNIVFRNDTNGWTVASLRLDGSRGSIAAVGLMPFLSAGERVRIEGDIVEHRDYGRQIRVTRCEKARISTSVAPTKNVGHVPPEWLPPLWNSGVMFMQTSWQFSG